MSAIIDHSTSPRQARPIDVRTGVGTDQPPPQPARPGRPPIPPSRRPLAEIIADPRYSDRAKRLAEAIDRRCRAPGKWAAWPKVSTIAHDLGWGGDPRAFRKRVERGARELIEGGDLARTRLGDLVPWFDAEGARSGLAWPRELPRHLRRSAAICVLGWKLAEAEQGLPRLTRCDTGVASGPPSPPPDPPPTVASPATEESHPTATLLSHPTERSNWNVETETTSDGVAVAAEGEGEPIMPTEASAIDGPPAARPLWTPRELAEKFFRRMRDRGLILGRAVDAEGVERVTARPLQGSPPIEPAEVEELLGLKPALLAFIKGEPEPKSRPTPATPPAHEGSPAAVAAKVPRSVRDRVVALIGRHEAAGGPADDVATARAIGEAIGDAKPESIEAFASYARDVRAGRLPLDALIGAFGAACGPRARNRGAVLVDRVQDWKAGHPGWSEGRGSALAVAPP